MLLRLHIRDLALIDTVELDFDRGLTVLTGETGAGKSILVDALALVLGDRADATVVRHGAQRAEVGAAFDVAALPDVAAKLRELALDDGDECLLRRVVGSDGRTRGFVNGAAVPLTTLREVGELLIDLHGQQAHQSLLQRPVQRAVLDHHGDLAAGLARVRERYEEWRAARDALAALDAESAGGEARAELLAHHVAELRALALADGEIERLDAEHRVLAHRGRLAEDAQRALAALGQDDDAGATRLVHAAARALADAREIDPRLGEAHEMTQSAAIQLEEAARALAHYLDTLDIDPAELARVEARLASIHDVARKHRVAPAELPALAARLEAELDALTHSEARRAELQRRLADAERAYVAAAEALSEGRARAAARLSKQVDAQLAELGMRGARFDVELTRPADARFGPDGLDQVTFLIAANPGQPPRPLAKVASGGELARIGLALQVVAAGASRIPCLVFDEVDSGIGGGVAEIVGRRLRALGETRQVLAVTHLPQVASQAHRHLRVTKYQEGERAHIRVDVLDDDAKVEELARMLGGIEITQRTRDHAREMLERAAAPRDGPAQKRRRR
jgi:DNA repair protein RecN (Recombination protein N)